MDAIIEAVVAIPEPLHKKLLAHVDKSNRDYNDVVAQAIQSYLSVVTALEAADAGNQNQ